MIVKVLGTAAGGGYPQWNCACTGCNAVRRPGAGKKARLQSSIAVSGNGRHWYLIDAGPDVRVQIDSTPALHPGPGLRESPISGVVLTDAQLDHVLGLGMLREGGGVRVYAAEPVLAAFDGPFPLRRVLAHFGETSWTAVVPSVPTLLGEGLTITLIPVGDTPPRYAAGGGPGAWACAVRIEDGATGGSVIYAPAVDEWTDALLEALTAASLVFFDGTFWTDDEMLTVGVGTRTAADMHHLPMGGDDGTVRRLASLHRSGIYFTHINNTNPVLSPDSREREELHRLGLALAEDGMEETV